MSTWRRWCVVATSLLPQASGLLVQSAELTTSERSGVDIVTDLTTCDEDADCCPLKSECDRHCRSGQNITDSTNLAGWRVAGVCRKNWEGFCLEDEQCKDKENYFCKRGWLTREGTCTFDEFCSSTDCGQGTCLAGRCTCSYGFTGDLCDRSTNAFAFLLYGPKVSYFIQARVLVQSLRAQGAQEDIVAIVPQGLITSTPQEFLQVLEHDGVIIYSPEDVPMPDAMDVDPVIHKRWAGVMNKFTVWNMTNYSHVALMDPDIVVDMPSENPGNMFGACKRPLCAVQDNDFSNINAGVMIVTPSEDRFSHIISTLKSERHHFEMPEQTFLTKYANNQDNGMELQYLDRKWNSCVGGGMLFNTGMASTGYNMLHSCTWGTKPPEVRLCLTDPTCNPNNERHTVMIFQHHHLRVDPCARHSERTCLGHGRAAVSATCQWCSHYCSDSRIPCSLDLFSQQQVLGDKSVMSLKELKEDSKETEARAELVKSCKAQVASQLFSESTWMDMPSGWWAWPQTAMYQLMTDRFASMDNRNCTDLADYCGGTFKGIQHKLKYLKKLGVDGVAISPVVLNMPHGYHGYWPKDLDAVNPKYGTKEELQDMVDQAHQLGIKVIVDVILNHAGKPDMPLEDIPSLSPFSSPAHYHSENCSMWYDEDFDRGKRYLESCRLFGMPDYKHEDPVVWQGLLQWLRRHVDTYGFDGIRVDAAKHIPVGFLKHATAPPVGTSGVEGPPVPTFYEVVHGDLKVVSAASNTGDYSVVYNYPLYHTLRDVFVPGDNRLSMTALADKMSAMQDDLNGQMSLNFLDNNDIPRFIRLVGSDAALYKNALAALLGMEGVPVLLFGSEQDALGRAPPAADPYRMSHDDYRAPLWEEGYKSTGETFTTIRRVLWLRQKFKGFHQLPAKILYSDHEWLVFARGPVVFVLTNVGGTRHSWAQRVLYTNSTTLGCEHVEICDVLSSGCMSVEVGIPIRMQVTNGMPKVYVPAALLKELIHAEAADNDAESASRPQVPKDSGMQLVQADEWHAIHPTPPVVEDIRMAARTPRAVLPPGVKVNDPPAWDLARAPHLDSWNPPLGESLKAVRRATLPNACLYIEPGLHLVFMPRPEKTFVLCRNEGECGYVRPRIGESPQFTAMATQPFSESLFEGLPVFHLTYAMLYAGVYHVMIEALPSIVPHLSALRAGSMRLLVHAGAKALSPALKMLGVLDATVFAPDPPPKGEPFHFCTPQLHIDMRNEGFFSGERLVHLRREMHLPDGPQPAGSYRNSILVLSRGNSTRAISNEDELVAALQTLGRPVEVIMPVPENFKEVVEAMSRAVVIVGAHGANMANLLFAAANTRVVEVVPQVPFHLVNNHFRLLSGALGLTYSPVGQVVENYDKFMASAPINQSQAINRYPVDVGSIKERVATLLGECTL